MFARLVGASWCNHPSHSCCPGHLCGYLQRPRGRRLNMPRNWVLPAPRAHQGVRRIQERLQEGQWCVELHWHPPAIYLPCLGPGADHVETTALVSLCLQAPCLVRSLCRHFFLIISRRSAMYVLSPACCLLLDSFHLVCCVVWCYCFVHWDT